MYANGNGNVPPYFVQGLANNIDERVVAIYCSIQRDEMKNSQNVPVQQQSRCIYINCPNSTKDMLGSERDLVQSGLRIRILIKTFLKTLGYRFGHVFFVLAFFFSRILVVRKNTVKGTNGCFWKSPFYWWPPRVKLMETGEFDPPGPPPHNFNRQYSNVFFFYWN